MLDTLAGLSPIQVAIILTVVILLTGIIISKLIKVSFKIILAGVAVVWVIQGLGIWL